MNCKRFDPFMELSSYDSSFNIEEMFDRLYKKDAKVVDEINTINIEISTP
jgi:hypothetical protein